MQCHFYLFATDPIPVGSVSGPPGYCEFAAHLLSMGGRSLPSSTPKGKRLGSSLKCASACLSCPKISLCLCCCNIATVKAGYTHWQIVSTSRKMWIFYWKVVYFVLELIYILYWKAVQKCRLGTTMPGWTPAWAPPHLSASAPRVCSQRRRLLTNLDVSTRGLQYLSDLFLPRRKSGIQCWCPVCCSLHPQSQRECAQGVCCSLAGCQLRSHSAFPSFLLPKLKLQK